MTESSRGAKYSDLFGVDPEFEPAARPVDEDDAVAEESDVKIPGVGVFPGHSHARTSDCAHCPICATIAVVRSAKPEVLEHLAAAARELIAAAGILLEEAGNLVGAEPPKPEPESAPETSNVRHLDIS
jgi:hypothetical protein